jgi:hypothetical protein
VWVSPQTAIIGKISYHIPCHPAGLLPDSGKLFLPAILCDKARKMEGKTHSTQEPWPQIDFKGDQMVDGYCWYIFPDVNGRTLFH